MGTSMPQRVSSQSSHLYLLQYDMEIYGICMLFAIWSCAVVFLSWFGSKKWRHMAYALSFAVFFSGSTAANPSSRRPEMTPSLARMVREAQMLHRMKRSQKELIRFVKFNGYSFCWAIPEKTENCKSDEFWIMCFPLRTRKCWFFSCLDDACPEAFVGGDSIVVILEECYIHVEFHIWYKASQHITTLWDSSRGAEKVCFLGRLNNIPFHGLCFPSFYCTWMP